MPAQRCYYEILGVERTADDSQLKKAYRVKALELHPDKNPHRIAEATQLFAQVQNAYQVLSDPHERSWYDSHRESILRGDDDPVQSSAAPTSASSMSINALFQFFSPSAFSTYNESNPKGFFKVYSTLFERLQKEEIDALHSDSESLANTDPHFDFQFEELVHFGSAANAYPREFYNRFLTFQSNKSFRWFDRYRLSDAEDRVIRRKMEALNLKLRQEARKEFNEVVRSLAEFVQKRDPRYKAMLAEEKARRSRKEEELKERRRRDKEEMLKKVEVFEVADWAKGPEIQYDDEEEDIELNEFYCQACSKLFKSDRQWKNHEVSKKHLKNVEILRAQLLQDDEFLNGDEKTGSTMEGFDDATNDADALAAAIEQELEELDLDDDNAIMQPTEAMPAPKAMVDEVSDNEADMVDIPLQSSKTKKKKDKKKKNIFSAVDLDSEVDFTPLPHDANSGSDHELPSSPVSKQSKKKGKQLQSKSFGFADPEDEPAPIAAMTSEEPQVKLTAKDKRRQREAKKTEKQVAQKLVCLICSEAFETRNQLYEHLELSGHASVKDGNKMVKK
ncbi:DnaJ domain-containing protein [Chytriomyces sp. MP71]|nr:DnaJ domain-containing protein [Chytriomyces sp. MP71]